MLMKDWVELTGIQPTTTEKGAISVCIEIGQTGSRELWHLDDYNVSSVCGPVVWLVPKRKKQNTNIYLVWGIDRNENRSLVGITPNIEEGREIVNRNSEVWFRLLIQEGEIGDYSDDGSDLFDESAIV